MMSARTSAAALAGLCVMLCPSSRSHALTPKEHYKKVVLRHIAPKKTTPPRIIQGLAAEIVHEYPESTTIYIAETDLPVLMERAAAGQLEPSVRDDFDRLQLPGGHIDVRLGTARSLPGRRLGPPAQSGTTGVFLLQFAGPITPEWKATVAGLGVQFIQYVPHNAYLVAGRPDELNAASRLDFVQFVDVFHATLKSLALTHAEDRAHDLFISVANVADTRGILKTLARLSETDLMTEVLGEEREELRVRGTFPPSVIDRIIDEPLVYAVSGAIDVELSDERQGASLGPFIDNTGRLVAQGGRYKSWLSAICPGCATLGANGFAVGQADTGFWNGPKNADDQPDPGPTDLPNTRVTYGTDYSADPAGNAAHTPTTFDDVQSHGTFVASILASNPAAGADPEGFFYGMGVAPSAGLVVTKINTARGSVTPVTLSAHDARTHGAFVQNHSYNESIADQNSASHSTAPCKPDAPDGKYTLMSRDFDRAVRDSNGNPSDSATPIALVVSAGNRPLSQLQGAHPSCSTLPVKNYTNPPGTAKNVIAVGGTETPRSNTEAWACLEAGTSSLWNVERQSKRGTVDPEWFKPDLMAPAANITGLRLESVLQAAYCRNNTSYQPPDTKYLTGTGTSFAAPVGSAAALLASRAYADTAGAASPALLKAMLIMSAKSMKGGYDYADWTLSGEGPKDPVTVIDAIPSQSQGFGRMSLEDILEPYPARYYLNQGHSLSVGGTWTNTYSVHDAQKPITVVLTWTDAPAQVSVGQMITNPIVNDLDLSVYQGATCTQRYLGNNLSAAEESVPVSCASGTFDRKNNVEYIRFSGAAGSQFTLTVKFETGTGGPQDFALAIHNAYDADDTAPPGTPGGLTANGASSTTATLSWTAVTGATSYDVRMWDGTPYWKIIATAHAGTTYTANGLTAARTYFFDVRARNAIAVSPFSSPDAATTFATGNSFLFTDDPLVPSVTTVKATHITELRQVITALRQSAGLAVPTYTDPTITPATTTVKQPHVQELRDTLNAARQALGIPPVVFTDTDLASMPMKAVHIQELRNAIK